MLRCGHGYCCGTLFDQNDDGSTYCVLCGRPPIDPALAQAAEVRRLVAEARAAPGFDRGKGRPAKAREV